MIVFRDKTVTKYQALVIRKALQLHVSSKGRIRVNSMYTPTRMMSTASKITGKTFKARDYQGAINALTEWIDGH